MARHRRRRKQARFQESTLRKALGDGDRYIVTVPGRGYQLAEPVRTAIAPESIVQDREGGSSVSGGSGGQTVAGARSRDRARDGRHRREFEHSSSSGALIHKSGSSIAVLPFKPIVAAQRDEALQIGMADTLIARISRLRGIAVRPLTAVRRYASLDQDAIEAGQAPTANSS